MRCSAWLCCLLLVACDTNGNVAFLDSGPPDAGIDTQCGPNLRPYKTACIPMLDDCPENHVAVPGGGCKRVGVEPCEVDGIPGIKGPPDWTCKRIGVVECEGGLRGPPDWKCKPIASGTCPGGLKIGSKCEPIGPPRKNCLPGWAVTDKDGWCEPVLPEDECTGSTMARIGHATCQPVGDCGSGPWGNIVATPATVFVDASSQDGDGSQAHPFDTIEEALSVVKAGGHIALAAGTYAENVLIDRAVTLEGRCAAQVLVQGTGDPAGVTVKAKGVVLRGLSVTAETAGVEVKDGGELRLEQVVVRDCGDRGVVARSGELTVQGSLVADNVGVGIGVEDGLLVLEKSHVRGTTSTTDHKGGAGVVVSSMFGKAHVELRDSLVSTNTGAGAALYGVTGTIQRMVVRDTQVAPPDGSAGQGIQIGPDLDATGQALSGTPSVVTVADTLLADNRSGGLAVVGSQVTVNRTVIRDTQEDDDSKYSDFGAVVQRTEELGAALTIRDSAVARCAMFGTAAVGAALSVERSVVQDTRPQLSDGGYGIGVYAASYSGTRATLTVSRSLVQRNCSYGLYAAGADAVVDESIVRNTATDLNTGHSGGGLILTSHPQDNEGCAAVLKRSTITGNAGAIMTESTAGAGVFCARSRLETTDTVIAENAQDGVFIWGSSVLMERSVVRDTRETEAGWWGRGIVVAHDKQGSAGSLVLRDSLIARNHRGIEVSGATATIERSMIRDHVASTRLSGRGLWAQYWEGKTARVDLRESVLRGNTHVGLWITGASVSAERTVVSGTRPHPIYADGRGVNAGPDIDALDCPASLRMDDCLVADNHFIGVGSFGADLNMQRTVVRDTRAAPMYNADGTERVPAIGNGINAGSYYETHGKLALEDTVVARSRNVGILSFDVDATIRRCRVLDTRPAPNGIGGDGIDFQRLDRTATLLLEDSQVTNSRLWSLSVKGATASIRRCRISDTAPGKVEVIPTGNSDPVTWDGFGDGVLINAASGKTSNATLEDCLIEDSTRAGLLFGDSHGSVCRSLVRRSQFAVSIAGHSQVDIAPDNVFEDNTEDLDFGDALASPAPLQVPPPPQMTGP